MRVRTSTCWILVSFWSAAALAAAPQSYARSDSSDRPHAIQAVANVDTLDYPWREVLPAAIKELEKNDWKIQRADSNSRRVVTHWKPLRHALARVFMGEIQAKVVVDLKELNANRTVLTFRGGLASDKDIADSPVLGAAQKSYRSAAERWIERVRRRLAAERAAEPTMSVGL